MTRNDSEATGSDARERAVRRHQEYLASSRRAPREPLNWPTAALGLGALAAAIWGAS